MNLLKPDRPSTGSHQSHNLKVCSFNPRTRSHSVRLVILESPYAGDVERNTLYARRALKDSLMHVEAPIASHLLYPQVLDDLIPSERQLGIDAGLAWRKV